MTVTIALLVSVVGIGGMLAIKRWELSRGSVPWHGIRFRLDAQVRRLSFFFRTASPRIARNLAREVTHAFAYHAGAAVLLLVRLTERKLLRFVNMIKGRREIRSNGSASPFLKDVTEHKNDLRRRRNDISRVTHRQ